MNVRDAQRLMAAAGYYAGAIDGKLGPKTAEAANKLLQRHVEMVPYTGDWTPTRRAIAAGQIVLHFASMAPGNIDGIAGYNTDMALSAWDHKKIHGEPLQVDRTPQTLPSNPDLAYKFPLQKDCPTYYGVAGSEELRKQLVYATTPYPLRLDWDLSKTTNRVHLHEKCAASAVNAMTKALSHYGLPMLQKLGLDRYAGGYANRNMRGGDKPSMHAYGAAIDFYAAPNGLHTKCPDALFCKKAYSDWFDIWESVGWVSLGREIGRDFMHLQAARLH